MLSEQPAPSGRKERRGICEQCIAICSDILLSVAQRISQQYPVSDRQEIVIASIARSINMSGAIRRLWADRPYAEEMGVLVRSLAEGMVNAAYIQIASDAEVNSYMAYDDIMLSKTLGFADELKPTDVPGVRADFRQVLEERAAEAKSNFSNIMSNTSWTKLNLHERSVEVAKHITGDTMAYLSRLVYRHGHTYTHATYGSLHAEIMALRTGAYPSEQVEQCAEHNLLLAAQCMYGFTLVLMQLTREPEYKPTLNSVPVLLNRYTESLLRDFPEDGKPSPPPKVGP